MLPEQALYENQGIEEEKYEDEDELERDPNDTTHQ